MYCWPTTVIQELSVHNIARLGGHTLEGKLLKMHKVIKKGPREVAQITLELARKKKERKKKKKKKKKKNMDY